MCSILRKQKCMEDEACKWTIGKGCESEWWSRDARSSKTAKVKVKTAKDTKTKHTKSKSKKDKVLYVFTDGACSKNPGPGGWGVVVYQDEFTLEPREWYGGVQDTTNNRMELTACIEALKGISPELPMVLHTDSEYAKNGISKWVVGWKRNGWKTVNNSPVKNKDLWQELDKLQENRDIKWKWVPAHTGVIGNERADKMAKRGIQDMMSERKHTAPAPTYKKKRITSVPSPNKKDPWSYEGSNKDNYWYALDYAPTNAAKCHGCQEKILKGSLRIARHERSRYGDDLMMKYYHIDHAFAKFMNARCTSTPIVWKTLKGTDIIPDEEKIMLFNQIEDFTEDWNRKCA